MSGPEFPPPPPVDEPVDGAAAEGKGSMLLGVVIGLVATVIGSFSPFIPSSSGYGFFAGLGLLPIVLVAGIGFTINRSTRQIGAGVLLGFAVGLVVSAGTCLVLLSNADFG